MSPLAIVFQGRFPLFDPGIRFDRVGFSLLLMISLNSCKEAALESSPSVDSRPTPEEEATPAPEATSDPTSRKGTLQTASSLRAARVRRVHALADQAHTAEQRKEAETELESLFIQFKGDPDPRILAIAQDLAARAIAFKLQAGELQTARVLAIDALAVSAEPTVMRANLLIALADTNERLNNASGARAALMEALKINHKLLEKELANP